MMRPILILLCTLATILTVPDAIAQDDAEAAITEQARRFSQAYMDGDIDTLVSIYTEDGVAAPGGRDFIRGHEALRALWTLPEGVTVTHHASTPVEITVTGDYAFDWGYYEGRSGTDEGQQDFRGKYLIVWHRGADGVWRMAHDMWNRMPVQEPASE